MSLKSSIPPNIYLTLNHFFPKYFEMGHRISPNKEDKNDTIEIITKHGLTQKELQTMFFNIMSGGEDEIKIYLTGKGSNSYDKSDVTDIVLFFIGMLITCLIYYFIKNEKVFKK